MSDNRVGDTLGRVLAWKVLQPMSVSPRGKGGCCCGKGGGFFDANKPEPMAVPDTALQPVGPPPPKMVLTSTVSRRRGIDGRVWSPTGGSATSMTPSGMAPAPVKAARTAEPCEYCSAPACTSCEETRAPKREAPTARGGGGRGAHGRRDTRSNRVRVGLASSARARRRETRTRTNRVRVGRDADSDSGSRAPRRGL